MEAYGEPVTLSSLKMIGDVNLFLKGTPGDAEDEFEVEAEIMIAGEEPPSSLSLNREVDCALFYHARDSVWSYPCSSACTIPHCAMMAQNRASVGKATQSGLCT